MKRLSLAALAFTAVFAAVIGTAVVPTLLAGLCFLPRHLLPKGAHEAPALEEEEAEEEG